MESKAKGNSVVTYVVSANYHTVAFAVEGVGGFDVDILGMCGPAFDELSENGKHATVHGIVQKVSDRAAIGRDPDTGKSASPAEKFEAMKEVADRLQSGGPWNVAREGGGNEGGLLYRAMKKLYPHGANVVSRKAFGEWLEAKAVAEAARLGQKVSVHDVRKGLAAVKSIAKAMDELRAEEAKATGIDGKALLAEMS